jgi:hypothetical protein
MTERLHGSPAPETMLQRLRDLSRGLLKLHKALLETERIAYEQAHGRVSSGDLLGLVINHPQFAWLRPFSGLIVQIDEWLDADEPLMADEAESLLTQARMLLTPAETGSAYEQRYYAALQREPGVVLAHSEVRRILPAKV